MRSNVSLLTAASELSATLTVSGYGNAVAAHVSGDWGAHSQLRLYTSNPFSEITSGHTITDAFLLRILVTGTNTDGTGDGVFTMPAIITGEITVGGPPIIISQPVSVAALVGNNVTFTVAAISSGAISYQWQKDAANVTGATASSLLLQNVQTSAAGAYTVILTNSFGSITSSTATLTVT